MGNKWSKISQKSSIFYLWLKLQWKKEPLKIKNEPVPLFQEGLTGIPTLLTWHAFGVYKIVVQPGSITLTGKQQHFIYIPAKDSEILTFTYHGINEKISIAVEMTGKDLIIHSNPFPEKIPLSQLKMGINKSKIPDFDRIHLRDTTLLLPRTKWVFKIPFLKIPFPKVNFNLNTVNIPKFK